MYINDYFILKIKKSDIKSVSQMLLVINVNALSPVRINTRRCYVVLAAQYDPISNPLLQHMRGSRGGQGVRIPLENHWVPSSAHQRNAIEMAFRWHVDDGPLTILIHVRPTLSSLKHIF